MDYTIKEFRLCILGNFVHSRMELLMLQSQYESRKNAIGSGVLLLNSLESGNIWFNMIYVLFLVLCDLSSIFLLDVCFLFRIDDAILVMLPATFTKLSEQY